MTPAQLMTVDDYFAKTPETVKPMELIHGVLRAAESPTARHQSAVARLFLALHAHVEARRLGRVWIAPLDVVLSERDNLIVQPDLFFVSNDREWIVRDRVWGAPDLVIEVLSPNPRIGKTEERVGWFSRHGVRECWLFHQDLRTMEVVAFAAVGDTRRLFGHNEPLTSTVLPEFTSRLDDVLRE